MSVQTVERVVKRWHPGWACWCWYLEVGDQEIFVTSIEKFLERNLDKIRGMLARGEIKP